MRPLGGAKRKEIVLSSWEQGSAGFREWLEEEMHRTNHTSPSAHLTSVEKLVERTNHTPPSAYLRSAKTLVDQLHDKYEGTSVESWIIYMVENIKVLRQLALSDPSRRVKAVFR